MLSIILLLLILNYSTIFLNCNDCAGYFIQYFIALIVCFFSSKLIFTSFFPLDAGQFCKNSINYLQIKYDYYSTIYCTLQKMDLKLVSVNLNYFIAIFNVKAVLTYLALAADTSEAARTVGVSIREVRVTVTPRG